MACDRETMLLISCYADDEATADEASRAKAHLEGCGECRRLVENWSKERTMLEWAYSAEMPEEREIDWQAGAAASSQGRTRRLGLPTIARRRFRLAWAGALAVLIVAGFLIYHIATFSPLLRVGTRMAAGKTPLPARMEGDIQLQIGPNSRISRIDEKSIRLEKGWVRATVRHGSGLRVLTKRIEVIDQGTRFQVGTGPKMDYVVVEEGSVSVSKGDSRSQVGAGQVLVAWGEGEPTVASLPGNEPGETETRLHDPGVAFVPRTAENLDWDEGLEKLAVQFPDARLLSSSKTGYGGGHLFAYAIEGGLRRGLRRHFAEIAQAIAGGTVDSTDWEIPVAVFQFRGIQSEPDIPPDVYYVRLVPGGGRIVWRLDGSLGTQIDLPFEVGEPDSECSMAFGGLYLGHADGSTTCTLYLNDWPGRLKPKLELEYRDAPLPDDSRLEETMVAKLTDQVAGIPNLDLASAFSDLLYLDLERKHWFLIAWNGEAAKHLCRLSDRAKRGRGGSIVMAIIAADVRLEEPSLPAGTYLVKLVVPGTSQPPYLGITDARDPNAAPQILGMTKPGANSAGFGPYLESLPGYERVDLTCSPTDAVANGFPIQFQATVSPGPNLKPLVRRGSKRSTRDPADTWPETWAEGWIRVSEP